MTTWSPPQSEIADIEHMQVDYARDRYAGHPVRGGIFNFGGGEIAIIYDRAPCAYQVPTDVQHGYLGYHGRAQAILARSFDNGRTWDQTDEVVVFDETAPIAERRRFLAQGAGGARERVDLSALDAAVYFGHTWAGEGDPPALVCFALRSADRGRTWESVPTVIDPPRGLPLYGNLKDGHPIVRMTDGTHLAAMTAGPLPNYRVVYLYGSDDDGLSWDPLAYVCGDATGPGVTVYPGLLLLRSGRLQCYSLNIDGQSEVIQMNYSDDGGYSWSAPRPIVRWGQSPWVALRSTGSIPRTGVPGPRKRYRSPWPLRLHDGRIVVLFARRKPPFGMGLILSEDEGETWSVEQVLRADGSSSDIGYPVATEVEPGRVFVAYYYTLSDGNGFGGTRFIAGTSFRLR